MPFQKLKKSGEFVHCPHCDSKNIWQTDYEEEDGTEDEDGRRCENCGWEGDDQELVSSAAKAHAEEVKRLATAEAAEAAQRQAEEAQHNRLMELHAQILRHVPDAYAVEATNYSTFEFRSHRYEIKEIE